MELPTYKLPSIRTVLRRMGDAAGAFIRRAGTLILFSMILVWALLYFPCRDGEGRWYEDRITAVGSDSAEAKAIHAEWSRDSLLGQLGQAIEPAVRPLGWDWRIGVAALASFPAREVVVGTLGIVYQVGDVDSDKIREDGWSNAGETDLGKALRSAKWDGTERPVFTVPTVLSLLVFFALCCQCVSTLAVIRRETHSWRWPIVTFTYMTFLAYIAALAVYQIGSRLA
jgi:ferrous iron transport protein B